MLQSPCVCRRSSARVPSCPLRHLSLPGVSLFRRFRCHLGRPHALQGPQRHSPPPGVSRFRRIGSHLRRVRHLAGTMAVGARKQAASCSTQKHRRRPPASEAPLKLFGKPSLSRTEPPVLRILFGKTYASRTVLRQFISRDSPRGRGDSSPPRRSRDRCVPCRSCRARRRQDWSRPSCRSPQWPPEASLCGCR